MSEIKLWLLLRTCVLARHPRGWIVGVTDLPLKDFVDACIGSELLTAEIEDGDWLCVIRYTIPDEERRGIMIIKKQDEAKLNTPVPFSEAKIQRLERERDDARRELAETISCIEQAIDYHQVHGQSLQASAIKNLLENINQRRKNDPR